MKTAILTIVNFFWNPILYVQFMLFVRGYKNVPFKRKQYSLVSSNYSLKGFNRRIKFLNSVIIALIFEIDHEVDARSKELTLEQQLDVVKNYNGVLKAFINKLKPENQKIVEDSIIELFIQSYRLDNLKVTNVEEYLRIASITIAMGCLANMIFLETDKVYPPNPRFVEIASKITRLVNDRATYSKDIEENAGNIYKIADKKIVNDILDKLTEEFTNYTPQNKIEIYLYKLTKLGLKLYRKKDFEL